MTIYVSVYLVNHCSSFFFFSCSFSFAWLLDGRSCWQSLVNIILPPYLCLCKEYQRVCIYIYRQEFIILYIYQQLFCMYICKTYRDVPSHYYINSQECLSRIWRVLIREYREKRNGEHTRACASSRIDDDSLPFSFFSSRLDLVYCSVFLSFYSFSLVKFRSFCLKKEGQRKWMLVAFFHSFRFVSFFILFE